MAAEAFADDWIGHTPFTAVVPGLCAYRCYPASGPLVGSPAFGSAAVLSFDDGAANRAGTASAGFAARNFQDTTATTPFFATEHVLVCAARTLRYPGSSSFPPQPGRK